MDPLSPARLADLPPEVARPAYDRSRVTPGIVHLGIGAFHRAHMAVYVDGVLAQDPSWGIIGASLRRPDTKAALEPQGYLYSVTVSDGTGRRTRVVGAILDIIDASRDVGPLLDAIADPRVRIVSLTVTEKGYCHDPATGALRPDHPDIAHDLDQPEAPRSAPGVIVAALARRRGRALGGLTVLSCDNLPGNGRVAERVVADLARRLDPSLADWIAAQVRFPSTMVDRIVPATTEGDREAVAALLGAHDAWPVMTEPFSQWVVEEGFAAGRPPWEEAGVQMAGDVEPFEHMKLRMLNGSHSTLAYLGLLSGHAHVAEAVADPGIRGLLRRLMTEEVMPTLHVPGLDLGEYRDRLLERFANPALRHRLAQIAMDGSQKLPQRILEPIRERLGREEPIDCLSLTVAAWIAFLVDSAARGAPIEDPMAPRLASAVAGSDRSPEGLGRAVLGIEEVFGADLAASPALRRAVEGHLGRLLRGGPGAAIAHLAAR